jgi:hypothetical protein
LGIVAGDGTDEMKTVLLQDDIQAFRAEWIREDQLKPGGLAWSKAPDSSMETVIYKGDSYVVDTSDTKVVDGKTYAIWYGGVQRARRLFALPGGGLRIAVNEAGVAPLDLNADQAKAVRIIGRVVHRAGRGGL